MKTRNDFNTYSGKNLLVPARNLVNPTLVDSETKLLGDEQTGENKMTTAANLMIKTEMPTFRDHPIFLWLTQNFRKIQQKPYVQQDILERVVNKEKADENLLGILLFGSLAQGTHTWKSDIDLIFIYERYEPESGLVNRFIDGVEVQYFYTTYQALLQNQQAVPYLLHIFYNAKILFDRQGTITPVVNRIEQYFIEHPEVQAEWARLKDLHQVEKRGPACQQTTIIQRWDELEDKYSGGVGVRKRTFFIA